MPSVKKVVKEKPKQVRVAVTPPNFVVAAFTITGTAPYVQNKFSAKAREEMRVKQEAGSTAKRGKREAKDFQQVCKDATHFMENGETGIPATAFRNAIIEVSSLFGKDFTKKNTRMCVFVEADGMDPDDGTPMVAFSRGEPEYTEMAVRIQGRTADLRARPMWRPGWQAVVRVRYDADAFTLQDVTNLLMRAGMQVGIGEGRPASKASSGMGWGLFTVETGGK